MNRRVARRWPAGVAVFSLLTASGALAVSAADPLDLDALRGKVVYVDFWASWCVPCRQSFPWMNDLQRQYGRDGFVVIAVNLDHERADAEAFLYRYSPKFRVAFDPSGALAERFHVKGMPTSFLIDRAGNVRLQHAGFRNADRDELDRQIRALLTQN